MEAPTPDAVRDALAHLDARRQKIVAGLFAVLVRNASRVRDREWVARQLTEVVVLSGDFEVDTPDTADTPVRAVQEFLRENAEELLQATFLVFQRVGLDLALEASDGFDFDEALRRGLDYLPPA